MTDVPTSYYNADRRGTPAFEALDQFTHQTLLAGDDPSPGSPVRILLASSLTLAAFTVVGLDANKKLVKAVYATDNTAIAPVGVLVHAAASGASNTTKHGEVWLTGNYNIGSDNAGLGSPLVWDASWDTVAKKRTAAVGNPNLLFRTRRATGTPSA